MKNDVNLQEMLCNKISENPRKGFLQLLARGMNKIKKRNIFSNPTSLKLFYAPGHGMFPEKDAFWDTLLYNIMHITVYNLPLQYTVWDRLMTFYYKTRHNSTSYITLAALDPLQFVYTAVVAVAERNLKCELFTPSSIYAKFF